LLANALVEVVRNRLDVRSARRLRGDVRDLLAVEQIVPDDCFDRHRIIVVSSPNCCQITERERFGCCRSTGKIHTASKRRFCGCFPVRCHPAVAVHLRRRLLCGLRQIAERELR
jgi:hypothetical protein